MDTSLCINLQTLRVVMRLAPYQMCEIWGSTGSENVDVCLPDCNYVRTCSQTPTSRLNTVSIMSPSSGLKTDAALFSEKMLHACKSTWRHNLEDQQQHQTCVRCTGVDALRRVINHSMNTVVWTRETSKEKKSKKEICLPKIKDKCINPYNWINRSIQIEKF